MAGAKPHVSDALRHLRSVVMLCSITLGACICVQTLVWAFVHFTDVRWDTVEQVVTQQQAPAIVQSGSGEGAVSRTGREVSARSTLVESVQVNRVPSRNDGWFRNIVSLVGGVGFIAAIVLVLSMRQGVVIAGGGRIPGVERAVTASTWALVVAMLCLPIGEAVPSLPVTGIFSSYDAMTGSSDAVQGGLPGAPGTLAYFGEFLVLPMLVLAGLVFTVVHFNSGIEQGMIVTSVNDLDHKLAREMSSIKSAATSAPRSLGALNRALGDSDEEDEKLTGAAAKKAAEEGRRMRQPNAGEPLHRPI
jgi:hypothetical protein